MKRLVTVAIFVIFSYIIFNIAPNYLINEIYGKYEIRVILDKVEITKKLPQPVKIVNGKIMLSKDTVDIFFDKYLYHDKKYDTIISTTDISVAKLKIGENKIKIDDKVKDITVPAQIIEEEIYLPIEELQDFYNIDIVFNEKVIITKRETEKMTVEIKEDIYVKKYSKIFSRIIEKVKAGDSIDIYKDKNGVYDSEWVYVRTSKGNLGYVKTADMVINEETKQIVVAPPEEDIRPKINMVWEYTENYTPDRSGESKIDGLNVVSPTWFYLKDINGNITSKVKESYISWASNNNYFVWAAFKNDGMGISKTSDFVTDMKSREKAIGEIVKIAKQYNLDGINIDFEEMKKEDINEYSQFVRELSSTLRGNGLVSSVDVTIPDGSDTWSLCYNRRELSDAVDYIILMAYDQYSSGSKVPGPVASYDWVEENILKMININREAVNNDKLILGIPFYSRLWTIKDNKVSSSSINMSTATNHLNRKKDLAEWLEEEKQYYIEYNENNSTIMLWIENELSLSEKVKLVGKYDLAGVASWRRGYETNDIWGVIKENL